MIQDVQTLLDLLASKQHKDLKEFVAHCNATDLAEAVEAIDEKDRGVFFRTLPKEIAADTFSYLSTETQENLIEILTDPELANIVDELFLDDAVDFIEEMPANVVKRVLKNASETTRQQINQLLQYQKDSAGSVMTTEYIALKEDMTVEESFTYIRSVGMDKETIYTCYVTDGKRILDGVVTVRTLLLANAMDKIGDIMNPNVIYACTNDDREQVAEVFQKYDLIALPVVDTEQHLVGIITVDDILEIVEEENTEDFHKMAGMAPSDEPYLTSSVFELAKKRIFWLLVLMVSATLTGGIISRYEHIFAAIPALIAAIPMLMDTGGNAGSQSSTLIIRGMAVGEISMKDTFRVFWKELRISFLVGLMLAVINILFKWVQTGNLPLSMTIGLSLFATVVFAKTIGSMLPLLAKVLKLDPALMAAPIITTIVDAGGLIVYFWFAGLFMNV